MSREGSAIVEACTVRRARWVRMVACTAAACAIVMVGAGRGAHSEIVTLAAIVFSLTATASTLAFFTRALPGRDAGDRSRDPAVPVLLYSVRLTAICYLWGAVAMQGLYLTPLTGLKWQHGWQYASVMALLALATVMFGRSLSRGARTDSPAAHSPALPLAAPLAAAQAGVAGIGLATLIVSGKLFSTRADWAANRVFAGLAVAIFAVSVASIVAQRHVTLVVESA